MDRCDGCGFVYDVAATAVGARVASLPGAYRGTLSGVAPVTARQRPATDVWSALEYVCHVRDVLLVQRDRTVSALVEDRPSFPRMHRDERVGICRYRDEGPDDVLDQLRMSAHLCATVFDGLGEREWARPFVYNWPRPAEHDLAWLANHALHEAEHHLADVRGVLARVQPHG